MVKSWHPGKVQAFAWHIPSVCPGEKLSPWFLPGAVAVRLLPGRRHGEKLMQTGTPGFPQANAWTPGVYQANVWPPGFYQANTWPPGFYRGAAAFYISCQKILQFQTFYQQMRVIRM